MSKLCIHEDCNNLTPEPIKHKQGHMVKHSQCNTCRVLKTKYRLTTPERDALLLKQEGCCAICNKSIAFLGKRVSKGEASTTAVVDHCHKTKKIRGILCYPCNIGIGKLQDDPNIMRKAIDYVSD